MEVKNILKLIDRELENNQLLINYYKKENEQLKKEVADLTAFLEKYRKEQNI